MVIFIHGQKAIYKKTHRLFFNSAFFQVRNLYSFFFLFWAGGRVPYNAGNTAGFPM